MDDYEKLKSVFDDIGVKYKEIDAKTEYGKTPMTLEYDGRITFDKYLKLGNGIGYYGFEVDFYFLDNEYKGHGVWE